MAFVEQGAKQPVLSCFLAECDLSNKSFIASSSTLEKHKDTNVRGLFDACAPDCLSKISTANDPTLKLASSSAIPHWMSTKQVQNILIDTSLKSGSIGNVVPSTVHEPLGSFCPLPSPKLGFDSEGKTISSIGIEARDYLVNSRHLFQQPPLPARPPLSACLTPSLSLKRDGLKEEPKISAEDTLSFFLHKQEKQPAKECVTDLPTLSLGYSSGQLSHQRAEVSSWVSKFPFRIASNLEEAECGQLAQHRENLGHRLLTKAKSECLIQGACKGVVNIPSQLMGSKAQIDHCKFLVQHSLSTTGAANDVLPPKTSLANSPLNSPWPLPATVSGSNVPSLKRDWDATSMQGVKHSQLLPDYFAQQKVTVVAKASRSHLVKSNDPEMTRKVSFSQKSLASRVSEENAGLNFPSLHGAFCSDNILADHTSIKQQEMGNGGEARTPSSEKNLHDSLRQVDLLRVKHETLSEDSETRESIEKHDKISSCEGRILTEAFLSGSSPAVGQAARQPSNLISGIDGIVGKSQAAELMLFRDMASTRVSTIASAGVPSLPLLKHSSNLKGFEGGKVLANKYMPLDGDWGDFLAAPSIEQTVGIDSKLMLPFQQRFEQLQNFLKKCDGSDKDYCLRALWSLSGSARNNHSAELESRAMRLSLEEGKEMKRAKLLNVLEEFPEGTYINPYARPMAPLPLFSASTAATVVKEA